MYEFDNLLIGSKALEDRFADSLLRDSRAELFGDLEVYVRLKERCANLLHDRLYVARVENAATANFLEGTVYLVV
jgi:hypothetical protein